MMYTKLIFVFFTIKFGYSFNENVSPPEVKLNDGIIVGTYYKTIYGREVFEFLGVPYAAPPIGQNRFEPPKPIQPWIGRWNATILTSPCLQYTRHDDYLVLGEEDCLYLNVYTPQLPDENKKLLDVIVFIHGGCFMFGDGNDAKADYLLKHKNIVFVTINFRLGPLGFLSAGDEIIPGNNGLKDQSAALRWVQKNIIKFGGNPSQVTISGLSSGAASVHYHLLSPMSQGLFHRGISQSGSALMPRANLEKGSEKSKRLASLLGCPTHGSKEMLDCLKTRPARKIVENVPEFLHWRYNPATPFGPTLEPPGPGSFLSERPIDTIRQGKVQNVPWLISGTKDEGLCPAADYLQNEQAMREINDNWNNIAPHILCYNDSVPAEIRDAVSRKIRQHFFESGEQISTSNYEKLIEVIGDRLYSAYIEFTIREQAKINPGSIYYYKFNYKGKYSLLNIYSLNVDNYGVSHGDDMQYVVKVPYGHPHEDSMDQQMIDLMVPIWLTFAQTGKPEVKSINWPPVSENPEMDGVTFLRIHSPSDVEIENINDTSAFDFWNSLLHEYEKNKISSEGVHEEL